MTAGTASGSFQSEEAEVLWSYTRSSLDQLLAIVQECSPEVVAWTPPAEGANSILAVARHTLANAEDNLLGVVLRHDVRRQREGEFAALGDGGALADRWQVLRRRVEDELSTLAKELMGGRVRHPRRGEIAVREVLLVVARHAAEHLGQAELTRDLAVAERRPR